MIKLGILDFDTSHVVEFSSRINHIDQPEDQWVDGAKVVVACTGDSKVSPERIPMFTEKLKKFGIPIVDKPEDMIGKVDAMLIESMDGSVHVERTKPFLEAGIPCFVDKPFACSTADAKAMIDLAAKKKTMIWSSSSLRYAPEIVAYMADEKHGPVNGCVAYGPGTEHDRNPGLFHYGTHTAEILYTVMGPGCDRVICTYEKGVTVATGHWKDGRVATARCFRGAKKIEYGFTAFADQGVTHVPLGTTVIFRELMNKVIDSFKTGKPALDPLVTLEMVAFMEAANKSGANHSAPVAVKL